MSTTPPRTIHILQMGKHFLYLPVYYAQSRNFFGYLKEDVTVVIDEPLPPYTDTATFDHVMDRSPKHRDFVMCITDPTQVLHPLRSDAHRPAVLATIVTNGSFWAVDHRTRTIRGLRDLGDFERIIAYKPGTTSYNIAARIARGSASQKTLDERIRIVNQGDELGLLLHPTEGANAVALSPDILAIEEMAARQELWIELALGETEEYSDVLVTALVSTQEFVSENPTIVRGILEGLQTALAAIRRLDPDVVRFAQSYFHYADRAEGALRKALASGVVPHTIVVSKGHWMRAARALYEAENGGRSWTNVQEHAALEAYVNFVEPYSDTAADSVKSLAHAPFAARDTSASRFRSQLLRAAVTGIIGIASSALLGWLPALILFAGAVGGILLLSISTLQRRKWRAPFLAVVSFVGAAVVALPWIPQLDVADKWEFFVSLGSGILISAAFEILSLFEAD